MTPNELDTAKRFLGRWWWTWTYGLTIWVCIVCVGAMKANNHLPQECPPHELIDDECFERGLGHFDWALFAEWMVYGAAIAALPTGVAVLNHLVFKGREKVGLTPEARREKMHRLERERDEANRLRINAERRTKQLEQELEIA